MDQEETQAVDDSLPETQEAEVQAAEPEQAVEQDSEKSNLQKRFDKITREKYEAFQERDLLKKQLEELQSKPQDAPKPNQEPTLESFDYDEQAYNQAVIAQQAEAAALKVFQDQQNAQKSAEAQQQAFARAKEFAAREAEFAAKVQDYDQVARNPMLPVNEAMAEIIQTSDQGPAIVYHLGKHPDQAYHIAQLGPISAQRELLRIEAGLEKPKVVSAAPAPVPDIGGTSETVTTDMDKLPMDEWIKRRNRQVHGS